MRAICMWVFRTYQCRYLHVKGFDTFVSYLINIKTQKYPNKQIIKTYYTINISDILFSMLTAIIHKWEVRQGRKSTVIKTNNNDAIMLKYSAVIEWTTGIIATKAKLFTFF